MHSTSPRCISHLTTIILFLENLALRKPTAQSSTNRPYSSKLAVDGNINGDVVHGKSCAHTKEDVNPWFRVDLEYQTLVEQVRVLPYGKKFSSKNFKKFDLQPNVCPPNNLSK